MTIQKKKKVGAKVTRLPGPRGLSPEQIGDALRQRNEPLIREFEDFMWNAGVPTGIRDAKHAADLFDRYVALKQFAALCKSAPRGTPVKVRPPPPGNDALTRKGDVTSIGLFRA